MDKFDKLTRYLNGSVVGMMIEYMCRVKFSVYPLVISILLIVVIIIDLNKSK